MIFLGIDPGKEGGWAVVGPTPAIAYPMPLAGKDIDLATLAECWRPFGPGLVACIEKVGSMPKQGIVSAFTFGAGYGGIRGVLAGLGIPLELVTPQRWKGVILDGLAKGDDAKASTIAWCRRAYPSIELVLPRCRVAHDGMADALAIATYAKRTYL